MSIHRTIIIQSEHWCFGQNLSPFLSSFLSFWGPVEPYLNSSVSLVGVGDKLLTNGGVQKQLCGCCQFINHTLLQVWHLALVWRVLWLKGFSDWGGSFTFKWRECLALLALHSWKFPWTEFWQYPLGRIWKPLLGATLSSYEENVGSPGRHSAAFAYHSEGSSATELFAASSYMGPNLKVSKYSPADIVSQLFHLDNSGLDSNPEPLRLRGIQCIPDDNPRDSKPCLCAASPTALGKDWVHWVWATALPPCNNRPPPFWQTAPWFGSFLPI